MSELNRHEQSGGWAIDQALGRQKRTSRLLVTVFAVFLAAVLVTVVVSLWVVIAKQDAAHQRGLSLTQQALTQQTEILNIEAATQALAVQTKSLISAHSTELTSINAVEKQTETIVAYILKASTGAQAQASLDFDLWLTQALQAIGVGQPPPPLPPLILKEIAALQKAAG